MRVADGDFLLRVDKPVGPTSHDVVAMVRRALGVRRVGHTGTLDPFASGLMILCVGRATRLAEYLSGMDKTYDAVARLGVETDTLDRDGAVVREDDGWSALASSDVEGAAGRLVGDQEQVPPQFSAKKVDGEAMHRRARRGEEVALAPVPVTVHDLAITELRLPDVSFSVRCSSGTYVRAIARDLGASLGCGAHLTGLRRTSVGPWSVEGALSADVLEGGVDLEGARIAPADAVAHLPGIEVGEDVAARVRNGQRVRFGASTETDELVAVLCADDLVAMAELDEGLIRPRKVFPA